MPLGRLVVALLLLPAAAFAQRVTVMIELQSQPAVESYLHAAAGKSGAASLHAATDAARLQIGAVEAEQQSLLPQLDGRANVLFRVQRVFNGIAVSVDASQVAALAKLPGVRRVVPIPLAKLDNTSSVPLIGAPDVWKAVTNRATGRNVKVGVIDTGIDYIHVDFGGSGTYAMRATNTSNVPWTQKVVGGIDLAGDDYDPSSADAAKRTPKPDPDPMDCAGHGSHVAGTIAGYGVLKNGATYGGTYDSIDESQFAIGPGVAPEAKLYAIRIFGCTGATALVTAGLEWALDPNGDGDFSDRMDVVNLSLGSPFGERTSPDTIAATNLARAGTVVVASAGNSGDTYFITGSPASGDDVISVASSVDALEPADGLKIETPDSVAGVYVAHHAVNFDWINMPVAVNGNVAYPQSQSSGCSGVFDATNAALINGRIALLDWTDNQCSSAQRVAAAADAGAIGVILRYPRPVLDIAIAGSTRIPSTLVTSDTGDLILQNVSNGVVATLSADLLGTQQVITDANTDTLSTFTARGPRFGDYAVKPEITAPGQSIYSVRALSGFRGISLNGTSMASPHVAGAMALLKQIHPDWTARELKALAMNTAAHDLYTAPSQRGARYAIPRIGAGRVDVARAANAGAVAFADGGTGLVGVSYGAFDVTQLMNVRKDITVENKSGDPITFALAYDAVVTQPGIAFAFPNGDSITVPAHDSVTFPLLLIAEPTAMRHHRDASLTTTQNAVTRQWLPEASGYVTLTSGAQTLRVPVLAVPRIASSMHAAESSLRPSSTMTLHLTGTTVATGFSGLEDENAIVSAYELVDVNAELPELAHVPWLNIKYAGIATDYTKSKAVQDAMIYFAITTYAPWTTPQQMPIRIDIDTNGDGTDDMRVTLGDLATFTNPSGTPSDVYVAIACTEGGTNCTAQPVDGVDAGVLDTVQFNTNVIVLPVRAGDLGLRDGLSKFTYRIQTGVSASHPIDKTARLTFDVAAPGLSFSALGVTPFGFADIPANTITIAANMAAMARDGARAVLLLHHQNATGAHEEVVPIGVAKHRAAGR